MSERIKLLGYRHDVAELCEIADVFVFPSLREGLPVSVMEAMASGLPIVCSRIRGNMDLIDENGGILFNPFSINECRQAIMDIFTKDMRKIGDYNILKINDFSYQIVDEKLLQIIRKSLNSI